MWSLMRRAFRPLPRGLPLGAIGYVYALIVIRAMAALAGMTLLIYVIHKLR